MFLDTDVSLSRDWRVGVLAEPPYSLDELQEILVEEVYPICRWNLFSIAGEWAGFDPEWLRSKILRHVQSRFGRPRWLNLGRLTVQLSYEWRQTMRGIAQQRAMRQDAKAG